MLHIPATNFDRGTVFFASFKSISNISNTMICQFALDSIVKQNSDILFLAISKRNRYTALRGYRQFYHVFMFFILIHIFTKYPSYVKEYWNNSNIIKSWWKLGHIDVRKFFVRNKSAYFNETDVFKQKRNVAE